MVSVTNLQTIEHKTMQSFQLIRLWRGFRHPNPYF